MVLFTGGTQPGAVFRCSAALALFPVHIYILNSFRPDYVTRHTPWLIKVSANSSQCACLKSILNSLFIVYLHCMWNSQLRKECERTMASIGRGCLA